MQLDLFKNQVAEDELLSLPEIVACRNGYKFEPQANKWLIVDLSRKMYFNFDLIEPYCEPILIQAFKKVLIFYLEHKALSVSDNIFFYFKKFIEIIQPKQSAKLLKSINSSHILNYKSSLLSRNEYYLTYLADFFKKWYALGYPGIAPEVPKLLSQLRLKGNRKGESVLTMDPEKGPFTEIELTGIYGALHDAYSNGIVTTGSYVLTLLFMVLGARNVQFAALKIKDFTAIKSNDGTTSYLLNIPRAKQRGKVYRTEFKSRAIDRSIGKLLEAHIPGVKEYYQKKIGDCPDKKELPMFPDWHSPNPPGFDHHSDGAKLYDELKKIFRKLNVLSERTGEEMKISPIRFRRTIGTRAAMEGHGELIIADLLDHTDTQNVGVYVEATPAIVERIDKALALQLAPMAQAFMGVIVEDESKAERGDDSTSRVRSPNIESVKGGSVGTCGKYGFCGAYAPIACYTCRKFQAWLDGPHEKVLEELILKRDKVKERTGDERIAFVNDRTIYAVADVVKRCKEIKSKEKLNA